MTVSFAGLIILLFSWLVPGIVQAPHAAFGPPHQRPSHAEVLFVGDMMFDRSVRQAIEREGADHILSCIRDELLDADMVVGNLEGPITDHPSKSAGSVVGSPENFTFTFDPETAGLLKRHNIGIVSLGNNHSQNFGMDGIRSTISYLREAGVSYFGDPISHETASVTINDIPLTFVSYNEFGGDEGITLEQVRAARARGEMPVIFAHWGDEYVPANDEQHRKARAFIDAGAEIVIGAHPHVVQEHETYNGKHVYYSLGNFVFDQYWNEDVRTGAMVRVQFTPTGVRDVAFSETYLERDRRTCMKKANDAVDFAR